MKDGWLPIKGAPHNKAVIVSNAVKWTLATRRQIVGQRLQLRWPFIVSFKEWRWTFSNAGPRQIDFVPTHYRNVDFPPPAITAA